MSLEGLDIGGSLAELVGADMVDWQEEVGILLRREFDGLLGIVQPVLLDPAVANAVPHGLEEGVGHGPADDDRVGLGQQVVDVAPILSDTFAPPSTTTNGLAGFASASDKKRSSFSIRNPTTRGLPVIALGTATIEASGRWAVPKASLT